MNVYPKNNQTIGMVTIFSIRVDPGSFTHGARLQMGHVYAVHFYRNEL